MQTSAVTYKIERYTIDQLESKIKTYGKTMSKKKSKKIRKEQAQELSSAEPEHPKLAAEKTAAIASYIKDPDYRLRCKAAIDILMAKLKMINAELSGQKKRTVISQITNRIKSAESIYAKLLKKGLADNDIPLYLNSPTNQQFLLLTDEQAERLKHDVVYSFWEKPDEDHTVIRLVTDWATTEAQVLELVQVICTCLKNS